MPNYKKYPVLEVNLAAIRNNARVLCEFFAARGVSVAGVIKFSDGAVNIARAYHEGGCSEIAASRIAHLLRIKRALPAVRTMLIRIPMPSEVSDVVRGADISLNSEEDTLRALNAAARRLGRTHGVVLMLDVGDLREGVTSADALCALALVVERELTSLSLLGIGTSYACFGGLMPTAENLGVLAEAAKRVEDTIGRKLQMVSGGSTVNLTLLANGIEMPPAITHLRLGGSIANPGTIRRSRGVTLPGMREDAFTLTAELVEVMQKPSCPPGGPGRNWAGDAVGFEDRGLRMRAILALGGQDVGDAAKLIPRDAGVQVIGCSSDHTILDVTDSTRQWRPGDTISFSLNYAPLLYAFATRHVSIHYIPEEPSEAVE